MTPPGRRGIDAWAPLVALLVFVAGRCLVPMDETDLFYNLRLGEILLTTHAVPLTNLLSFTYPNHPDPNLAWVFQVLLALAHRLGGVPATVVLKTAFVVATFALLYRVALRRGAHPALAAAALALGTWAAEPRFVERPHLITFLGLAATLLALERAESGRPRLLWALVPLGLVWANGNSCFFLAPSLLLLYAVGAALDGRTPSLRRAGRQAALVAVALLPLLFATPSGSGWIGYVANHFRMPTLRPLQEYRGAEWPTDGPFLFLLLAVALVTIAPAGRTTEHDAHGGLARPHGFLRRLLPVLSLAVLGSRRIRFAAEFALCAAPFVAGRATDILRHLRLTRGRVASVPPSAPTHTRPSTGRAASVVVALGLAVLAVWPRLRGPRRFDLGIEEGLVPFPAVRWVDAHGLRDRMYNDLEVGSYLTWDGWPGTQVFQDPRINGYPADLHAILRRTDLRRDEWESLLTGFDTRSALITFPDVNPRAALFAPDRWALVYRSAEALVFVRRDERHATLIAADELPLTFTFDPTTGVAAAPLKDPPPGSPVRSCEWQRRLGEWFATRADTARAAAAFDAALAGDIACLPAPARDAVREQAAALALGAGRPARAIDLLHGLASSAAITNRGFALLQMGRPDQALRAFDLLPQHSSDDGRAAFGRAVALTRLRRTVDATAALRAFILRWPDHFAAIEARRLLATLTDFR